MVELERLQAVIVPAPATPTAHIFDGHPPNLPPPLFHCGDDIGSAVGVAPHTNDPMPPGTVSRSTN